MEFDSLEQFLKAYGWPGVIALAVAYFIIKILPGLLKTHISNINDHFVRMAGVWDEARKQSEEQYKDVLEKQRQGTKALIEYLRDIRAQERGEHTALMEKVDSNTNRIHLIDKNTLKVYSKLNLTKDEGDKK